MKDKKILYIDTETTGLNPVRNDVIQVAGIIEIGGEVKEEFDFKCQPWNFDNCDASALAVHGNTIEKLKTFDTPKSVHQAISKLFEKYVDKFNKNDKFIAAGQNVAFDIDFMRQFFKKAGDNYWGSWVGYQSLDTIPLSMTFQMAKVTRKTEDFKLQTLCNSMGIALDDNSAHNALNDIRATRSLLLKYLDLLGGIRTQD